MTITTIYECDNPACNEAASDPVNWILVNGGDPAVGKWSGKQFHNEACLEAYLTAE
jgi:hypothetical protein